MHRFCLVLLYLFKDSNPEKNAKNLLKVIEKL